MKRRQKTPREALLRALDGLPFFAYGARRTDVLERLERYDRGGAASTQEAAGIVRQIWSDLEDAVRAEEPDWRSVKALHRVWMAAITWDKSERSNAA
jgi:hypothetical protein